MDNKNVLNENELMQVIGGKEEYSIRIPESGPEFWRSWNPSLIIDPDAPIHFPM